MRTGVLLAALTALFSATDAASQSPVFACSGGGNYTSSSSYHQTLELLSSTLPQKASTAAGMFATDSVLTGEVAYALAQCRGDTDPARCSRCIDEGLQNAEVGCGLSKEVLIAFELCTLQLSGTEISWSYQVNQSVAQLDNVTVQSELDLGIGALSAGVASMAAHRPDRFATAVEEIDVDGKNYRAYGLAQCTLELTPAECFFCLEELRTVSTLVPRSGGWFATTWCSYQFHLYKFFASEPMQHIPSVTSSTSRGDRKKRRKIILGVVVGLSVVAILIVLTLIALFILRRKRRSSQKNKKTSSEEPRTESPARDEEEALGPPTEDHTARVACPSAIGFLNEITDRACGKQVVMFFDYDGTLTPIIDNPLEAHMAKEMRQTVEAVARWFRTSIVTGREVSKAMDFVKLDNLNYAGSHGLDIKIVGQEKHYQPFPELELIVTKATECLEQAVQGIEGAFVENNKFCVSVHFRNVDEKDWKLVEDTVNNVLSGFPALRLAPGKMVWEFRSKEKFTKGDAVDHLLQYLLQTRRMDSSRVLAIHIGDDTTDEDAFKMLREKGYGFGILVTKEPKHTEAVYSLKCPDEVKEFLQQLVTWKVAEDWIVEES